MSISVESWRRVPESFAKRAFEVWVEKTSLNEASRTLKAEGWLNSSGRPYSGSQIATKAKEYLLEHWQDLRDEFNADRVRMGLSPATQTEYEESLVLIAARIWGCKTHVKRFWSWIDANDFSKYEYVWKTLPVKPLPGYKYQGYGPK